MQKLNNRQIIVLKSLTRSPKTTAKAFELLQKNTGYMFTKRVVYSTMRSLENRELVRAREQFNSKLSRTVILWELTNEGRKALAKK